ncbi:MAG TPA: hypothetical protein PLT25_08750 [Acidocella sp.]|nr:hypothetical protein [Acidocella sp.]
MATGDQNDMVGRLRALLPQGWFPTGVQSQPSTAPVLYAVLSGIGSGLAWGYSLVAFALAQVLIATSTDVWLDLHAFDYLGTSLLRRVQERDVSFLARVQAALFPPANTRAALIARLKALTGRTPIVFEPTLPSDTGAYGYGGLGYGVAGGYGSLALPFQAFVTAYRPLSQGVPLLAGYSGNESTPVYAPLGYGSGLGSYVDLSTAFDGVTDADIYATVAAVEPAGSIVWTKISS